MLIEKMVNSTAIVPNIEEVVFKANEGNITLSMMMTAGNNDCWGPIMTNITISKVIYSDFKDESFEAMIDLFLNNNMNSAINKMPGNRIFLNVLAN